MVEITFIQPDGARRTVSAVIGRSLMEAAKKNDIAGIVAECGGACACGTCHVYVAEDWVARLPAPDPAETSMLEFASAPDLNSRLSCQLTVTSEFDGLTLRVPESQP